MITQRALWAVAVALAPLVAACGNDSDRSFESNPHACPISYDQRWQDNVKSMQLLHVEPKTCPIPMGTGEIGKQITTAGTVRDREGDDVLRGATLFVIMLNGCRRSLDKDALPMFVEDGADYVAQYSIDYPAATGILGCNIAMDIANVSTNLADLPENDNEVSAEVSLTLAVSIGRCTTSWVAERSAEVGHGGDGGGPVVTGRAGRDLGAMAPG